jgi:DNA replication and repair protein RecF
MIKRIILRNFRNHFAIDLKIEKPFVYFYGPNGCGKTSILESVYFCATTKSHRTSEETDMILKNEAFTQVRIVTDENQYEITMTKKGKRASINHIEKRKLSDYIGNLRVVLFAPEDLELIKGSPTIRRQFLDMEWMQLNKHYLRLLNTYKHILKQRNILLKKINVEDDYTFLDILGDQLFDAGIEIMNERKKMIDMLNLYLNEIYALFSTNQLQIIYDPNVDEKSFKKHLKKQQKTDILYQTTTVGPHRDDFYIQFNGFDAKTYASQGEQRLIVVALKLSLLKLIKEMTKQHVILLLDDVLSELDLEKQKLFLLQLPKEHQIMMNSALPIEGDHIQMIHLIKE